MKNLLNEQSDHPASDGFFYQVPERVESWLLVTTEFPSVNIVTSFTNIKQT